LAEISRQAGRFGRACFAGAALVVLSSGAFAQVTPAAPVLTPVPPLQPLAPAPSGDPLVAIPPAPPVEHVAPAPTPAQPALPGAGTVLRIGILGGENGPYRLQQTEPFRNYLRAETGAEIEILAMRDYASLIDAQVSSLVQYAIYSASAFVTAEALCSCVEPIAAPADPDGSIGFYSVLLSRADGPITNLEQARGARLALVAGNSIAGRMIPLDSLAAAGIEPAAYFAATVDVATPEAAVTALLAGEVDVAVAWSSLAGDPVTGFSRGVLTQMVGQGTLTMDQLRVVWRSELIPYGPHAIRSDVSPELKAALVAALANASAGDPAVVDAIELGGATGFVTPDASIYDPLRRLVAVEKPPLAP
jgi:phosphonate transport system substrate-binding protein